MNRRKVEGDLYDTSALRRWIVGMCIIRFDLEQGQLIEECIPGGSVSSEEELDIAFSSFPDSMSQSQNKSTIHDCIFFFKIRRRGTPTDAGLSQNEREEKGGVGSRSQKYLYGYVFNRQRQDERLKRGGEQKSVVILSHMPYLTVFKPLLQILGPLYFDMGKLALEHVCTFISRWPVPAPGKFMELPIGSATLKTHLPPTHGLPSEGKRMDDDFTAAMAPIAPLTQSAPQGIFHEADLFGVFRGVLLQLWTLWELLLIGEPVLVIAPTPPQCCEAVAGLVSLIAPLPCSIDFRPYFTIHDPDFVHLNSLKDGEKAPPMILGVTNLFFLKALQNQPHIVSVGSSPSSNKFALGPGSSNDVNQGRQFFPLKKLSPANLLKAVKLRKEGPLSLMTEHKEAIWTSYSATMKPDTAVLNRLVDAGVVPRIEESMSVVNNEILRRHFLELTTNFLAPFGPYLRANTPPEGISPFVDPPPLARFDAHGFLEGLAARGPGKFLAKRMRSNWLELYRNFLRGPNFMPWFQRRRSVAEQEQHRLWSQARAKADIQKFILKMQELELVDAFNVIERQLLLEIKNVGSTNAKASLTCLKLKSDLRTIFNALPKDMQDSLLLNSERMTSLQSA